MTELDVALEAAVAAGRVIGRGAAQQIRRKGDVDLVTEVDEAAEAAIRAVLGQHLPDIDVLAEEGGGAWDSLTRWVVDPLDGTTNFVHGLPWYCVSIALEIDGVATVGVVYDPVRDVAFVSDGRRAWTKRALCASPIEGPPLRVSETSLLGDALVATGFATDHKTRSEVHCVRVEAVLRNCRCVRRCGSAALDLAHVAAGVFDVYLETDLHPWDVAAGVLLVSVAGGRVTDWNGGGLDRRRPSPVATNGLLHSFALTDLAVPKNLTIAAKWV